MSIPIRAKIGISLLSVAAITAGMLFFFAQAPLEKAGTLFRPRQVSYAGGPTTPTRPFLASATSTPDTSAKVPILVYHIVRPAYATDSKAVTALAHTPEVFDAEMKYLGDAGYHVISLSALENYLNKDVPLPTKPIVITFDDGWSDQFTYAFPILEKYHYTATFFVFTNPIGRRGFMTWDNLRALRDAGMTIGSHTLSHPFLTKIAAAATLWNEVDTSKHILEKNLGITVHEFAYPFGQYNAATLEAVKKAGYTAARGDYIRKGGMQSVDQIYELSALNAPTTTEKFAKRF